MTDKNEKTAPVVSVGADCLSHQHRHTALEL